MGTDEDKNSVQSNLHKLKKQAEKKPQAPVCRQESSDAPVQNKERLSRQQQCWEGPYCMQHWGSTGRIVCIPSTQPILPGTPVLKASRELEGPEGKKVTWSWWSWVLVYKKGEKWASNLYKVMWKRKWVNVFCLLWIEQKIMTLKWSRDYLVETLGKSMEYITQGGLWQTE